MDFTVTKATKRDREMPRWRNGRMSGHMTDYTKKPRVYVSVAYGDDESVLEHLYNRRNRPVAIYRKAAVEALEGLGFEKPVLRWSQHAGCSCPCSPGFILTSVEGNGANPWDVFVTIQGEDMAALKNADAEYGREVEAAVGV